jgi:hypothetical protein
VAKHRNDFEDTGAPDPADDLGDKRASAEAEKGLGSADPTARAGSQNQCDDA